jgi:5-methylcytosine-specific restriction endonuclease McrA
MENLEVDHRVSLSDGGPRLDRANLQVLCRDCHEHKTHEDRHKREREGRRYLTPSG